MTERDPADQYAGLPDSVRADIIRWQAAQRPPRVNTQPPMPIQTQKAPTGLRRLKPRMLVFTGAAVVLAVIAAAVFIGLPGRHRSDLTSTGSALGVRLIGRVEPVSLGTLSARDVSAAQTTFGFDLLAHRCVSRTSGNDVLSPASAALALAMLDAGARGRTEQSVSQLLHLPGWSADTVAALAAQHRALAALTQMKSSNHLYASLKISPQQQVLNDLATGLNADVHTLDFAGDPERSTSEINNQVNRDTDGLIPSLFDQPLDPTSRTVLVNALYLDAAWEHPFAPAQDAAFYMASGATEQVPLMTSTQPAAGRTVDGWTAVTLPYSSGRLESIMLLPPAGSRSCALPTSSQLTALSGGASTPVQVTMPTLHLTQSSLLTEDLADMGLPLTGNYSGFGRVTDISRVDQKTVLDVDEHGTKAAAASGVIGGVSRVEPASTVVFNRPYIMLIRDTATGAPLFLSRIGNPSAGG